MRTIHFNIVVTQPTDAKKYLDPTSFHPQFVFDSMPFSQETKTLEICRN